MMLSQHFALEELLASDTAVRCGIDNAGDAQIIRNLTRLAATLERVRQAVGGPIHITSGYRSPELNARVGGSKESMHMQGLAADIICPAFGVPLKVCRAIAAAKIPVDQVINEYAAWCHVGLSPDGQAPRNQTLTIAAPHLGYELGLRSI